MDKIEEVLTRGVDKVYPSKEAFEKVLRSGKKLRLYQGFDPTGTQLHIGHMTGLMKLHQFQELGHHVIFLIGDGTGQAGDPSGKKRAREKFFTNEELRVNAKSYVMQAAKIVKFDGSNPAEIVYNSDWLNKLKLVDILNIAQNFSLQQLEERDLFVERKKRGEPINMREFLYPLLQGYDSAYMKVDLEIGGTDQTFNMLCGRTLVKNILGKEKFVLTTPLLTDSQGNKIGKTEGNVIALTAPAKDFFGMIMSLSDDVIVKCFEYLTNIPSSEVQNIEQKIKAGENPMIFKKKLAHTLTAMLNSQQAADEAQQEFEQVHQKDALPSEIKTAKIQLGEWDMVDLLIELKLTNSRSEAKMLVNQKAVEINGRLTSHNQQLTLKSGDIIKVGKRKWLKIK